jgi:hypothetical protein
MAKDEKNQSHLFHNLFGLVLVTFKTKLKFELITNLKIFYFFSSFYLFHHLPTITSISHQTFFFPISSISPIHLRSSLTIYHFSLLHSSIFFKLHHLPTITSISHQTFFFPISIFSNTPPSLFIIFLYFILLCSSKDSALKSHRNSPRNSPVLTIFLPSFR